MGMCESPRLIRAGAQAQAQLPFPSLHLEALLLSASVREGRAGVQAWGPRTRQQVVQSGSVCRLWNINQDRSFPKPRFSRPYNGDT